MRGKNSGNGNEAAENQPTCELTVQARGLGDTINTHLQLSGIPESNRQAEGMALNVIARTMAFLYEGALVGSGREDSPESRAIFFAGLQPTLMHMFLGITGSQQFQQSVAANRAAVGKRDGEPENKQDN